MQPLHLVNIIKETIGDLMGKTVGFLGLSFKPNTDDVRETRALSIIEHLFQEGVKIRAYDPKAMHEAQEFYLKGVEAVTYCNSKYETLVDADAMILLTDWKEFRIPDFEELKAQLKQPVIFDGRNQYSDKMMKKNGFEYFQIGKKSD